MADIELVIKIPEELYNRFGREYREENLISRCTNDAILEALCNGTPLPKRHGRIGDLDKVKNKMLYSYDIGAEIETYGTEEVINYIFSDAPTIIEADKEYI